MKKYSNLSQKRPIYKKISEAKVFEAESENQPERSDIVKFFSKLFESKEMAHIYHLQVKGEEGSYAAHKALGNYYEDVIEVIDDLIEVYMGQYDVVEGYDIIDTNPSKKLDPVEYFMGILSYIQSERKVVLEEDTHIHSLIDDALCLLCKLLYKLKYNK